MPISKVKQIQSTGTYESQHGTLYKFEYLMEDESSLVANHKTKESPFSVGDEVDYHIKGTNNYGSWGSVKKPEQEGSPNSTPSKSFQKSDEIQDQIIRQSCLKASIEYHGGVIVEPIKIAGLAQYFFEYCKTGELKPQAKEVKNEE